MQPSPSRTLASVRQAVFLISMPFFVLGLMLPIYDNGLILAVCALVLLVFLKVLVGLRAVA